MAKNSISSLKDFNGKQVRMIVVQKGSEEVTGEIISNKDGNLKISQTSRGSTYTYRIPANEVVYVKSEGEAKLEKGETVCLERQINKRTKINGVVISLSDTTVIIDQGEKRGSMVTSVFPLANVEEISFREQTAEGKKASKEKSERMKAAREEKGGKKSKKEKKEGKKLKLLKGGKKSKKAA